MTTNTLNKAAEAMRQYKEYAQMKRDLDKEMEQLKSEIVSIMNAEGVDEIVTTDSKATFRERISKRFATTEFKKVHKDLYDAFTTQTSAMYFTCN